MKISASLIVLSLLLASIAHGQPADMPAEYKGVLDTLGKQGDFKDGVLKVNIPRSDLKVVVDGIATPTPFGFGGWIAMTKGTGMDVMMGDLVLTEDQVGPVMTTLLEDVMYDLPDRGTGAINVDRQVVNDRLRAVMEDEDLRRYIL